MVSFVSHEVLNFSCFCRNAALGKFCFNSVATPVSVRNILCLVLFGGMLSIFLSKNDVFFFFFTGCWQSPTSGIQSMFLMELLVDTLTLVQEKITV